MTGRIDYTPEAQQQLNALDDWISEKASREVAQRFVSAILDCIDGILDFPRAGRARDDVRSGMRTTTLSTKYGGAPTVQRSANSPQEVRRRPILANGA